MRGCETGASKTPRIQFYTKRRTHNGCAAFHLSITISSLLIVVMLLSLDDKHGNTLVIDVVDNTVVSRYVA